MPTIEVPRNTFYKKQSITTAVTLKPQFADLPSNTDETFTFNNGGDLSFYALSGSVPANPSYGEAVLEGAHLRMYVSGVTMDNSRYTPQIVGYALNPKVTLKEGGFSLANASGSSSAAVVGNMLAVYSSQPVNDIPYVLEEFEGNPEEFQSVTRMGGNNQITYSSPYITLENLNKIFHHLYPSYGSDQISQKDMREFKGLNTPTPWSQSTGNVTRWGSNQKERITTWTHNLQNMQLGEPFDSQGQKTGWGDTNPNIQKRGSKFTFATTGYEVVFEENRKFFRLIKQSWPLNLNMGGASRGGKSLKQKFSMSKFGVYLSYAATDTAAGNYEEGSVGANQGNTLLRDIYATRDFSNPYDANDNDPMLVTVSELSSEKSLNGGQSLRMYHNWGYSEMNPQIQNLVSTSGNLNPQCARASLYNIPFPKMPFDIAQSTYNNGPTGDDDDGDRYKMQGDVRGVVPEIKVGVNITKLAPNILLNGDNTIASGTNYAGAWDYYDQDTIGTGSLSSASQTLLRTVAITFSNYKPKDDHITLDDFLNYGLSRFYGDDGTCYDTDNIVGGVMFNRFGIDGTDDTEIGQNIFGLPLPVTRAAQVSSVGMLRRMVGKNGTAAPMGGLANLNCLTWGTSNIASGPNQDDQLRFVQLPMNSWFTCKFFTDVMAYNNTGSLSNKPYAPSGSDNKSYSVLGERGVIMRAMFDTEAGNPYVSGALNNPNVQDIPFIDIPFPAGATGNFTGSMADSALEITSLTGLDEDIRVGMTVTDTAGNLPDGTVVVARTPATGAATSVILSKAPLPLGVYASHVFTFHNKESWNLQDNPTFYPQHMTLWVQNYPWVAGGVGKDFLFGDNEVAASGAAREAEVFFDSISLNNFTPRVTNLQPDAAEGIISFKPQSHFSPISMQCDGTTKFKKAWVGSPRLEETATCRITETQSEVEIITTGSNITTYDLQNAGTVSVAGTGIQGATTISSFDANDLQRFTMSKTGTSSGDVTVTFTSTGNESPPINRGELYSYDSGYTLCFGWDDKGDLPISVGGGLATFDAGTIIGTNADGTYYVTSTKYSVDPDTATSNGTLKVVVAGGGATATVTVSGAAIGAGYSVNDTFTLSGTAVGGSDDDDDAITVDVASVTAPFANDSAGYILGNDYNTLDFDNIARILPNKNRGGGVLMSGGLISKSTDGVTAGYYLLGGDLMGSPVYPFVGSGSPVSGSQFISGSSVETNLTKGTFKVHNGAGTTINQISLGTGTNNTFISTDGFTQKGFMKVNVSDTNAGGQDYTDWEKRENVMVCTKIVNIPDITNFDDILDNNMPSNSIIVEDSGIFNPSNPNETYRIFRMGEPLNTSNYKGGLKLNAKAEITENRVSFSTECSIASDDITRLLTEENLPQLYIGPEKHWINVLFDTPADLVPRTYGSFCTINETPSTASSGPVSGSTFNEFIYSFASGSTASIGSSALYQRIWDMDLENDNDTYALGEYGYGTYDSETGLGGNILQGPAYLEQYNYYDLGGVVGAGIRGKDSLPFVLSSLSEGGINGGVTFYGDEYTTDTTKQPTLYWQYLDNPPSIMGLTVEPAINVIDGSGTVEDLYDLTTENLNAVKFNWAESGDDIWYRLLMIDDTPIVDKYHKATMWLPMNESVNDVSAAPSYTVHNPSAGVSGAATVGSLVRGVLEGQAGWAPVLDNSAATGKITVANAANYTNLKDLEEFTLVLHWTPSVADKNAISYIATATTAIGTAAGNFELYKDASNNVVCKLGADIAMTGSSSVLCNADVPTNIIITFNKNASSAIKARLFVDGIMVANSTGSTEQTTTADFVVGGVYDASYRGTTGMIEEVVLYSKAYEVPEESNSYIMNTVDILDQDGTRDVTHNARLFAADYHNFRGVSAQEIGMSGYTSWRCTTL
jgi:hypothetical protein